MPVNASTWKSLPVAARELEFNADAAIANIFNTGKGDTKKIASAFLWRNANGAPNIKDSYRLPIGDIINGRLTMVPRAVFSAAQILSGAHGGLEDVVDERDRTQLKAVITQIYDVFQKAYGDQRVEAPWLKGRTTQEQAEVRREMGLTAAVEGEEMPAMIAAVNASGWTAMPMAEVDRPWSGAGARGRLSEWADGDMRKYRRGFLWWDGSAPDETGSYKLPIADVIDGKLTIVPRAVNAVSNVLAGGRGGVDIPDNDMDAVEAIVQRLQKRFSVQAVGAPELDVEVELSLTADGAPAHPPKEWFDNPQLEAPTKIAVTADGRVMGHLAAWGVCHMGIGNQCVMAPRTASNYKYFLNGTTMTADGSVIPVGKITMGGGHADTRLGWIPAADHYDSTSSVVAIVSSGEDAHGIWVAGTIKPGVSDIKMNTLRESPLSGDWRRVNGNLELVAALAVNTPGFPIISMNASGDVNSILATGMILEDGSVYASAEPDKETDADFDAVSRVSKLTAYVDSLARKARRVRLDRVIEQGEEHGMW